MALNKIKVNDTTTVNTGVVYDISKATSQSYDSLSAALGTSGNNVPPEVREGGMSIRFVSNMNSDNKYVQYRLTANEFSIDETKWQKQGEEVSVDQNTQATVNVAESITIGNQKYNIRDYRVTDIAEKMGVSTLYWKIGIDVSYIDTSGNVQVSASGTYFISEPFDVKVGDVINITSAASGYTVLAKVDNNSYIPLVLSPQTNYNYTVTEDSIVVVCGDKNSLQVNISRIDNYQNQINQISKDVEDIYENVNYLFDNEKSINPQVYFENRGISAYVDSIVNWDGQTVALLPCIEGQSYAIKNEELISYCAIGFSSNETSYPNALLLDGFVNNVVRANDENILRNVANADSKWVVFSFPTSLKNTIKIYLISQKDQGCLVTSSYITEINNKYIGTDNIIRDSSINTYKIIYFPCLPGENYTVQATVDNNYFGCGYTSVVPDTNVRVSNVRRTNNRIIEIKTGLSAKYLVICADMSDSNVSITMDLPHNKECISIPLSRGSYDNDDFRDRYRFINYRKSHSINTNPIVIGRTASVLSFSSRAELSGHIIFIRFRNADGSTLLLLSTSYSIGSYIKIPIGTKYVDFTIVGVIDNIDMEIYCSEQLTKTVITKRIYTNSYDQIQECFYVDETKDIYSGCCYMLPPNYSAVGKKVPIIIWFDGNAGYSSLGAHFTSMEDKLKGLKYLRDEGYAVIQVFGWGSYFQEKYSSDGISCGYDTPCCTPTNIACIKKGIELFCEHYNVDGDDIHVVSKSFGGLMSLYLATNNFLNVKSISMFSPLLDMFAYRGRIANARKAIWEDLNMHGGISGYEEFIDIDYDMTVTPDNRYFSDRCVENTWRNNLDVLAQINPVFIGLIGGSILGNVLEAANNGKTYWEYVDNHDLENLPPIYTNTEYKKLSSVPIKIWGVTLDDNVPYANMVEVVNQIQNAGNRAELHTEISTNHSLYDATAWNVQSGITELGISYTNISFGWVDAIKWIRTNSVK